MCAREAMEESIVVANHIITAAGWHLNRSFFDATVDLQKGKIIPCAQQATTEMLILLRASQPIDSTISPLGDDTIPALVRDNNRGMPVVYTFEQIENVAIVQEGP
jgi:hypothetical protein